MVNIFLKKIIVGLIFNGVVLLTNSANAENDLDMSSRLSQGAEIYEGTCIACHGESGKGEIPGVADFTEKNGSLAKTDDILFEHILNGYQSDNSDMEMPALGGNEELTEEEIKNVLLYIRDTFQ